MSNLYQLSYISKNLVSGDKQALQNQIESILDSASTNNLKLGVTGALLYTGGYFCQVIEGEEENIEELFETIQLDNRHAELTVLNFEKITERNFSQWSMAFAGIEDSMRFDIAGIKDSKDHKAMKKAGDNIVSVLENLVRKKQATT
ncbi:BLUF domain-containing protein [Colwellia echini]|uniref:BLUF domain-containing protein n=1 Tax=Colwellia echini TaxID=1982103 RepID=A0ABY3MY41_9GAMM|nr:BLUF domain-containing protein [Colwellia echini]TYK66141.1 BLUF domain-containing protein [Colwellia echini]